ncbi:MAG: UPF0489 family protein [Planctomycetes bacterium]|nr:UPF0489 family protein [Planctomycetota bacterium]
MANGWLMPFKGRQCSGVWDQNFLWRQQSVYIMDNHRAALWCWLKHRKQGRKYNLFHIDRHYDTLNASIGKRQSQSLDLREISIGDYLAIDERTPSGAFPLIRWDNYLSLFLELHGDSVEQCIFATHEEGDEPNCADWNKAPFWDIPDNLEFWLSQSSNKWIFNIDLDFFFCDYKGGYRRMLADEYANAIFDVVHKNCQNETITVLTIALSPGFCGGWEPAEHLCQQLCDVMGLQFALP